MQNTIKQKYEPSILDHEGTFYYEKFQTSTKVKSMMKPMYPSPSSNINSRPGPLYLYLIYPLPATVSSSKSQPIF